MNSLGTKCGIFRVEACGNHFAFKALTVLYYSEMSRAWEWQGPQ